MPTYNVEIKSTFPTSDEICAPRRKALEGCNIKGIDLTFNNITSEVYSESELKAIIPLCYEGNLKQDAPVILKLLTALQPTYSSYGLPISGKLFDAIQIGRGFGNVPYQTYPGGDMRLPNPRC